MRDLSGFDMDEAALVKKPKPIGWFAAGLILILALGFVAAYHLPLQEAHATLLEKHEQLAKKSAELDQALKAKVEALKTTTERKDNLERFLKAGQEGESKVKSQIDVAQATAERQLSAYVRAKLARIEPAHEELTIGFSERAVFANHSERIVPQVTSQICKATDSLGQNSDFELTAEVLVAQEEKDAWELAGERAGAVGDLLAGKCKLDPAKVAVRASLTSSEPDQVLVLHLGPAESPRLKASEAPAE